MVERCNERISDILATTRFHSCDDLQSMLERYEKLYNEHSVTKRPCKRSAPGAKIDLNSLLGAQRSRRDWAITQSKTRTIGHKQNPDAKAGNFPVETEYARGTACQRSIKVE